MPSSVIVGTQWGDEGKGKIIDIMAKEADLVVRSSGGNNAGHTVVHGSEVYKLHLLPSGILYPDTICLIGSGVVVDPKVLLGEISEMNKRGVTCENLRIDARADIIMPWHKELDKLEEEYKAKQTGVNVGTTGRGIGPAYTDKARRIAIRMYDLCNPELLKKLVKNTGEFENLMIEKLYGGKAFDLDAVFEEYKEYGEKLSKYMADGSVITFEAYNSGKKVLFEGAQATLLDIDFGTYPFVTSSHPIAGGACIGTGIGPKLIDEVIGVGKSYTTRVGNGPFPTELNNDLGELIRNRGGEFGTTTGRPRRTGWFDAVIMRHAVRVNGLTALAINKFDTLSGIGSLKVCTAYQKSDGTILKDFPVTLEELEDCTPVYEEFEGYEGELSGCKSFEELPEKCRAYIAKLEELCGCPIKIIGVGAGCDEVIFR
ncbi:MAG: adenylosuccinate synthase [Oscillospiraceae bacterium]|nr:adenylosuccinate synthase [Oscillospiraceae bacterium]